MFTNRIDYWMNEKGIKNKHLASLCNVSEQTFSRWRQNKTQPDLHHAWIIADTLSINIDDLINKNLEDQN